MNVYLTFDVEVWCRSWSSLDAIFPMSFERYVYGRSKAGEYALPEILKLLKTNELRGVFFIEPLFAARFGQAWLNTIVDIIRDGWARRAVASASGVERRGPAADFPGCDRSSASTSVAIRDRSRTYCSGWVPSSCGAPAASGCDRFVAAVLPSTGTLTLRFAGMAIRTIAVRTRCTGTAGPTCATSSTSSRRSVLNDITVLPITLFRDGSGRLRPAQVGSASFPEIRAALESAHAAGNEHFVILAHNFEMLKVGKSVPDPFVVRRFGKLCSYLRENADRFSCRALTDAAMPSGRSAAPGAAAGATVGHGTAPYRAVAAASPLNPRDGA